MIFEELPLSRWQRVYIWVSTIKHAATTSPPKTLSVERIVREGDAGYEDAIFEMATYTMRGPKVSVRLT